MLQKRALQRFNNDTENMDYGIFLGKYYPIITNQIKTIDRLDKELVGAQQYYDAISKRQTDIENEYNTALDKYKNIDPYSINGATLKQALEDQINNLENKLRAANTDLGNARTNLKDVNTEHKAAGKDLVGYFASAYNELGGLKTSFIERDGILYGITVDELNKTVNVFTPMMQGAKTPAMQQNIAQVTAEVKNAIASGNFSALPATPAAATVAAANGGVGGGGGGGKATTITGASNVPGGVGLILPSIGGGGGGSGSIPVQPDVRYEIRKDGTLVKNTYDLRTNALLSSTTNLTDKDYTEVYGPRVVNLNRDGSQTLQYGANGPKFTIEATEESIAKANDLFINKAKADKLTLEKLTEDLDASRRTRALEIPKTVYELGRQRAADIAEAQKASAEAARSRADIQLKEQQNKLSDLVAAGKITIPQALRFMGKFQEAAIEVERARQNFEAERSKRMEEKARAQEFADKYETEDQITNVLNAAGGKVGQAQNAARQAALAQYAGATPGQKLANLRGFDTSYQDPGLFANTDLYKNLNAPMTPEAFGLTPTSDILSTLSSNLGNKNPLQDYINSPESLAYLNAVRSLQTPATSPTMPEFFSSTMR
jgi:polyhydroxyalkanoate synthesis regulator phasin